MELEVIGMFRIEVFSFKDGEDGRTYRWNATLGRQLAMDAGTPVVMADLGEAGMTQARIRGMYPDIDTGYASALPLESLLVPLLFVRHRDKDVLIDGWHRIYKAAGLGIGILPAYILTQEQADSIRQGGRQNA